MCIRDRMKRIGPEEYPGKAYEKKSGQHFCQRMNPGIMGQTHRLHELRADPLDCRSENKKETVQRPPDYIRPICSVPQPAHDKDDDDVYIPTNFWNPIS